MNLVQRRQHCQLAVPAAAAAAASSSKITNWHKKAIIQPVPTQKATIS